MQTYIFTNNTGVVSSDNVTLYQLPSHANAACSECKQHLISIECFALADKIKMLLIF